MFMVFEISDDVPVYGGMLDCDGCYETKSEAIVHMDNYNSPECEYHVLNTDTQQFTMYCGEPGGVRQFATCSIYDVNKLRADYNGPTQEVADQIDKIIDKVLIEYPQLLENNDE